MINIVGDDVGTANPQPEPKRALALERGYVINGLVIGDGLNADAATTYYADRVVGPSGVGFVMGAEDVQRFGEAMRQKIIVEMAYLPW